MDIITSWMTASLNFYYRSCTDTLVTIINLRRVRGITRHVTVHNKHVRLEFLYEVACSWVDRLVIVSYISNSINLNSWITVNIYITPEINTVYWKKKKRKKKTMEMTRTLSILLMTRQDYPVDVNAACFDWEEIFVIIIPLK